MYILLILKLSEDQCLVSLVRIVFPVLLKKLIWRMLALLQWFLVTKWFSLFILIFVLFTVVSCSSVLIWFFWGGVPLLSYYFSWLGFAFLLSNRVKQKNWLKSTSQNVPSYLLSALFPLQISWQLVRICQRLWEQAVGLSERRLHVPLIRYLWWQMACSVMSI